MEIFRKIRKAHYSMELILGDNVKVMGDLYNEGIRADLIYGDCIYEDKWMESWLFSALQLLKKNGIFIVQTDWHTVAEYKYLLDRFVDEENKNYTFVNHLVWKNEWGNHPKDRFHQCFDDILIYCRGKEWKFYSDRIQVPKATANTKLNPSGRSTKTATCWIDDICLTTTSKERVKLLDGHLIKWQKPLRLFDRIITPFVDSGDLIIDPFMGSGSLGVWCKNNNRNFIGIENDPEVFKIASERISHS